MEPRAPCKRHTWTHAQLQSDFQSGFSQWGDVKKGDLFPYVPAHQGSLGLGVEKGKFTLDLNATFVAEMRDVAGQGDMEEQELIPANKVIDLQQAIDRGKGQKSILKWKICSTKLTWSRGVHLAHDQENQIRLLWASSKHCEPV